MDEKIFAALVEEFYLESSERLVSIEEALLGVEQAIPEVRERLVVTAKRELHTLKGNSGMMGLAELQELAHRLEDQVVSLDADEGVRSLLDGVDTFRRRLDRACGRETASAEGEGGEGREAEERDGEESRAVVQESVRVSFAALDHLVDQLSEMVIFRNRLADTLARGLAELGKSDRASPVWREVESAHETLNQTLEEIQNRVMRLRLVPLGTLFAQLKRIVYDESAAHGKRVEFETSGGETPLDKALLEVASEAMGHLVRNAIVHGIETVQAREEAGKDAVGRIAVTASTHAEEVVIDITDDGQGVDRRRLLDLALERGFEVAETADLQTLLSVPGLSTHQEADRSAGRGMGMSAVVESVRKRGGQMEVASEPGRGSRFRLRLPLTMAIVRALLVRVGTDLFALPLSAVQETLDLAEQETHRMNGARVVEWRDWLVPVLDLAVAFSLGEAPHRQGYVVVIEAEGRLRGLVVDSLAGIQDIVVKPLDEVVGAAEGLAGCTILGDGRVILILDPAGLTGMSPLVERAS